MSSDDVRRRVVETAARLLKDRPEAERETLIKGLGLTPAEEAEVRRLLQGASHQPAPEALRKTETFQRLVQDVRRGKAVLFLGAGVSQDVGMPSSDGLVDALRSLAQNYRVEMEAGRAYPLPALAGLLERSGLRREVVETLRDRFAEAYRQASPPYRKGAFRLLPYLGELNKLMLTTNWDDLLEEAFREAGEPAVVVRRDRELPLLSAATHAVVKLHGDFTDPAMVIVSDTDYSRAGYAIAQPGGLAGSLWGMVSTLLAQYSYIFVGYRLADEDMKLLRALVAARQAGAGTRNYMVGLFREGEAQNLRDWLSMEVVPATASQFFVALAQELAEFANRRDDLERIFRRESSPFLEFYAPFGTGKHALLDEVERRAKEEGWRGGQIIRVDLQPAAHPLTAAEMLEHMARAVGQPGIQQSARLIQALKEKGRVLILFEHTEAVEASWAEFITFICQVVAPVVRELDEGGQRSRLILSGRYPVQGWPYTFKRHAEVFPLSPFTLSAVREMVGKYTLFHDLRAEVAPPTPRLVEQIYDLTGGSHPGFIKEILDDLMKKATQPDGGLQLPAALSDQEIDTYLASFAGTIHKEAWATTTSPEVGNLFAQGLCVLRALNASLVARLSGEAIFCDLFSALGKPEELIDALRACHLLTFEFPLEIVDPVVRCIHSHILRRKVSEPERFRLAHQSATSAWQGLLSSVEDLTQLRFFREWLYHLASHLHLDGETKDIHWQILREAVDAIPFRASQHYPVEMGATLLQQMEEKKKRDQERDGELLDVLLACLGEAHYEEFRQLVTAKKTEVTL